MGFDRAFGHYHMGTTAENVAREFGIDQQAQDAFALASQQKAAAAQQAGRFAKEIAPVTVASRKGEMVIDADEYIRVDASAEALARLRPASGVRQGGHGDGGECIGP